MRAEIARVYDEMSKDQYSTHLTPEQRKEALEFLACDTELTGFWSTIP
jgi:hypothetical protein